MTKALIMLNRVTIEDLNNYYILLNLTLLSMIDLHSSSTFTVLLNLI
jgi:hypothetical protein